MTRKEAKDCLALAIKNANGCKGTEVPLLVKENIFEIKDDITNLLEEMVEEGLIMEVQYVLPHLPNRIKSFYLPKGTEVHVI